MPDEKAELFAKAEAQYALELDTMVDQLSALVVEKPDMIRNMSVLTAMDPGMAAQRILMHPDNASRVNTLTNVMYLARMGFRVAMLRVHKKHGSTLIPEENDDG